MKYVHNKEQKEAPNKYKKCFIFTAAGWCLCYAVVCFLFSCSIFFPGIQTHTQQKKYNPYLFGEMIVKTFNVIECINKE